MRQGVHSIVGPALAWFPELGFGYYPVEASPYDAAYFERYRGYEGTEICRQLNEARVGLVRRHWQGPVCDVGIGSGAFVLAHGEAAGFDVNPAGVDWLVERGLFHSPYDEPVDVMCFWDSLEHIPEPAAILAHARKWVFVSLPIFSGPGHVVRSKHYRKDEHYWYFTRQGFLRWMSDQGFTVVEINTIETDLGREGIESYAFRRDGKPRA